jgi:hypothetical protein
MTTLNVDCIWNGWTDWSSCNTTTGKQTRTAIVTIAQKNNGAACPSNQNRDCKVDCSWNWTDWKCNAVCPGNSIQYRIKSNRNVFVPGGFGSRGRTITISTHIDEDKISNNRANNFQVASEEFIETDILKNNGYSNELSKNITYFRHPLNNSLTNAIQSFSSVPARNVRTMNVKIAPINNGNACPLPHGTTELKDTCSTNCLDCKYSLTETSPCNAVCPGNANYLNRISNVDILGNQATRKGLYNIIKEPTQEQI